MTVILMLAVTVEALVEYGKSIVAAAKGSWKVAALQLAAVVVSAGLCVAANADLFKTMEFDFSVPWLGQVLTGILISRGANYVSDLVGKMTRKEVV